MSFKLGDIVRVITHDVIGRITDIYTSGLPNRNTVNVRICDPSEVKKFNVKEKSKSCNHKDLETLNLVVYEDSLEHIKKTSNPEWENIWENNCE